MSTNDSETTALTKTPASSLPDPINVYAVISLVAALLGLFPVAIVFGILAFTRPVGRGIAIAGLVLGILELAALLLAFFGVASAFNDDSDSSAAQTVTSSVFEPFIPTGEAASTTTSPAPSPTETALPPTTTALTQATPTAVIGDFCTDHDAQATTADGSTAYCSRRAGTDAYLWASSPGLIPNPDLPQQSTPPVGGTDAPVIGSPCSTSELGQIRASASGQRVRCGYTGEDSVLWLALD
ncbi:DUF4190 domain-containing protein [Williamsia deligens]|uniref:DUF4190 domain-containing protein n=1 Tax=Williamsia deligens TaxID=321325 RepID=A0ABW3G6J8_9NOCA|nr:DUF4190 domain-containing protein [Williamsia deligens]MCP2193987.1 hypothetical protein [Williamsia deligens]